MKWTTILIALFALIACNDLADKNAVEKETNQIKPDSLVHIDSFYIDENEINGGREYKEFHNCEFGETLQNPKTPKLAKDIYLDNDWDLSKDNEALALLDSLTAKNTASRPFYFKVVTKTYKRSDGYFSEGLGLAGKEFVENHTQEFAAYFDNKNCFTENDLETWTAIVMLEFGLLAGDGFDKSLLDNYNQKLKVNCKDCSAQQQETINKFAEALKSKCQEK